MTYRERREARAERLRDWAAKRTESATATINHISARYRGDFAFNTQPGHIPERARVIRAENRALESLDKAEGMAARAGGIEHQLETSIYDDDPDAISQLKARIENLSALLEAEKAGNKAWRKGGEAAFRACGLPEKMIADGLRTMGVCPYLKGPFFSTNTAANLRRNRQRLERLEDEAINGKPWRYYAASKYPGTCAVCGNPVEIGSTILYREGEVKHYACSKEASHD